MDEFFAFVIRALRISKGTGNIYLNEKQGKNASVVAKSCLLW